jgi:hypothetical protein
MKATTIIIALVLSLQTLNLFAINNYDNCPTCIIALAPTTPSVATFDDVATLTDFVSLVPVTPVEADFSDAVPETNVPLVDLAPITPIVADFNDNDVMTTDFISLVPVTPIEADFSDTL